MEFQLKVPKGKGVPLGNSLRQLAMSRIPAWCPIAMTLDRDLNIMHPDASIVEDTISIYASIRALSLTTKDTIPPHSDFLIEHYTFTGTLYAKDIKSEYFSIEGGDSPILTCTDNRPVTLTLAFRNAYGEMNSPQNNAFLESNGEDPASFVMFNSRHTDVSNFSFDVTAHSLEYELLIIRITSKTREPEEVLRDSLNVLHESVLNLRDIVAEKDSAFYTERA